MFRNIFSKIYKTQAFQNGVFYTGFFGAGVSYVGLVLTGMSSVEGYAKHYGLLKKPHELLPPSESDKFDVQCTGSNSELGDPLNPFDGPVD